MMINCILLHPQKSTRRGITSRVLIELSHMTLKKLVCVLPPKEIIIFGPWFRNPSSLYRDSYICTYNRLLALCPTISTDRYGIKTKRGGRERGEPEQIRNGQVVGVSSTRLSNFQGVKAPWPLALAWKTTQKEIPRTRRF